MTHVHVRYLVVGGGEAADAAVLAIRGVDATGSVLLVGQESARPYRRALLSGRALQFKSSKEELFIRAPEWYRQKGVELRTGRRAVNLDPQRQSCTLDDGQEIAFDRLLIATGAVPRPLNIPGSKLPNLHYLRTLDDLERLHHALDQAAAHGHRHLRGIGRGLVTVIGGGILGAKLVATLTRMKFEVDWVIKGSHPCAKFAGPAVGKWIARWMTENGVVVHTGGEPARLEGDGRVQRIALLDGKSLVCDLAIAAVGMIVNRDLLRGTSIRAEKAILTDAGGRTSAANVFAAGDCAAIFDPLFGKHRMLDHFEEAVRVGAMVGRNMAGADEIWNEVNCHGFELFDAKVKVWGEHRHVDHHLVRGAINSGAIISPTANNGMANNGAANSVVAGSGVAGSGATHDGATNSLATNSPTAFGGAATLIEFGIAADGRISQVVAVGETHDEPALAALVQRRANISGLEEQFKNPSVPIVTIAAP